MPGEYVFIVVEYGDDWENTLGVYTREWAEMIADHLTFVRVVGDRAYFRVPGEDVGIEMRRMMVDA
jgi:hypothetical protein